MSTSDDYSDAMDQADVAVRFLGYASAILKNTGDGKAHTPAQAIRKLRAKMEKVDAAWARLDPTAPEGGAER